MEEKNLLKEEELEKVVGGVYADPDDAWECIEAAKTAEEKKKLLAEASIELTDEEIEKVTGAGGIVVEDWQGGGSYE